MSAEPQPTGRAFGKYELVSLIARGGMGEVYLASLRGELGFERKLVVKTIRPELAQNPKFVDLFAAEAKTAVALTHGNIVPIYELGRSDDTLYIAMGYVDGPSVSQLMRQHALRGDPLDVATALFIVREVLTGLAYAHTGEVGRPPVVHRDISPRNILLDRSGQVRIVDFGIALPAEVQVAVSAGSSGYMAPEQARAAAADPRADVFSSACVLYELLTARRAFPGSGVWLTADFEPIPAPLRPLLQRALALEPQRRPVHAAAFLRELSPLVAELAPTYTTQDLADHLRALFPSGWDLEASGEPVSGTPATPAGTHVETFATRLTAVKNLQPEQVATPLALPPAARVRARPFGVWVGALALAGAGLAYAMWSADQAPVERAVPEHPTPASADRGPTVEPEVVPTEPTPPPFVLTVEPGDARVTVTVDGAPIAGPPFVLEPPAQGALEGVVLAPGFRPQPFALMPEDRGRFGTKIELIPLGEGTLEVFAPDVSYAEVWVDRKKLDKSTPLLGHTLVEGKHVVKVVCPVQVCGTERKLLEKRITIEPKQTVTLEAKG